MVNVDVVVEVVVVGDVDVVGGATQYAQCDAHMESRPQPPAVRQGDLPIATCL